MIYYVLLSCYHFPHLLLIRKGLWFVFVPYGFAQHKEKPLRSRETIHHIHSDCIGSLYGTLFIYLHLQNNLSECRYTYAIPTMMKLTALLYVFCTWTYMVGSVQTHFWIFGLFSVTSVSFRDLHPTCTVIQAISPWPLILMKVKKFPGWPSSLNWGIWDFESNFHTTSYRFVI